MYLSSTWPRSIIIMLMHCHRQIDLLFSNSIQAADGSGSACVVEGLIAVGLRHYASTFAEFIS